MSWSPVWWRTPRLRDDRARTVGWLELFFDLVFVVVVSQLAHQLSAHPSPRVAAEFVVQFAAVFWIWNAFTYYTERFESGGLEDRVFTFIALLPIAALAVFADRGLNENDVPFALAYIGARTVNMIGWIRAARHVPTFRPTAARFLIGFGITTAIILASLTVGPGLRLVMWAIAVLIDIATPAFTVRQQMVLPPISSDRFPERFGLFTLIVLGESIIGVINGLSDLSNRGELAGAAFVSAPLGLAIGFGLWWIYFDFIARRPPRPVVATTLGWVYLHLVLATMITITGAGITLVLANQANTAVGGADAGGQHLLATGVGGSLVAVALLETTLAREHDEPTHELVSPGLKIGTGVVALAVGWLPITWPVIPLFVVLLAALAIPAVYAVHVWFERGPGLEDPVPAEPVG